MELKKLNWRKLSKLKESESELKEIKLEFKEI